MKKARTIELIDGERALATGQALICRALREGMVSRKALCRRMGITPKKLKRLLRSDARLQVKTLGQALAACGARLELRLS